MTIPETQLTAEVMGWVQRFIGGVGRFPEYRSDGTPTGKVLRFFDSRNEANEVVTVAFEAEPSPRELAGMTHAFAPASEK